MLPQIESTDHTRGDMHFPWSGQQRLAHIRIGQSTYRCQHHVLATGNHRRSVLFCRRNARAFNHDIVGIDEFWKVVIIK